MVSWWREQLGVPVLRISPRLKSEGFSKATNQVRLRNVSDQDTPNSLSARLFSRHLQQSINEAPIPPILITMNIGDVNGEHLFLLFMAGAALGLLVGVLHRNPRLNRALRVGVGTIGRTRAKAMRSPPIAVVHNVYPVPSIDWVESIPNMATKGDPRAIEAAGQFHDRLACRYGDEIVTVFLFGSRVRGKYLTASDVDLAVLFSPRVRIGLGTYWMMWRIAFKVLLDIGLYLQPRPLQLNSPINSCLVPTISREGMCVSAHRRFKES